MSLAWTQSGGLACPSPPDSSGLHPTRPWRPWAPASLSFGRAGCSPCTSWEGGKREGLSSDQEGSWDPFH